jgi:hypothetical protein
MNVKAPKMERSGNFFRLEHYQDRTIWRLDFDRANGMVGTIGNKNGKICRAWSI